LESRLRLLEAASEALGPGGMEARFSKMEKEIDSLDIPDLRKVRPELSEHKEEYEAFEATLRHDMNELKVLVGCLEACIPRETRKAVDLFKRAAGADDRRPSSPRQFEVEGKILRLRDDMDTRIREAETAIKDQCDRVTQIVRSVEKRQNLTEEKMKGEPPGGTAKSGSSPSSATGERRPSRGTSGQEGGTTKASPQQGRPPPAGWSKPAAAAAAS